MSSRTDRRLLSLALAAVGLLALAACRGARSSSAPEVACRAAGETCGAAGSCCTPSTCTGGTCAAPASCAGSGAACAQDGDCCSPATCAGAPGVCTVPASCAGAGAACAADTDCCAGLACPATGAPRTCQAVACSHFSEACSVPSDCCPGEGLGCAANVCVSTALCDAPGASCASSATCCSNACANGICTEPANTCRPLTATCAASQDCCSGHCDASGGTGTCASACRAAGAPCAASSDCCSSLCAGPAGAGTCVAPAFCAPAGEPCTSSGECCSLSCDGASGTCGGSSCRQLGDACAAGGDCCTGVCTAGACAPLPGGSGCRTLFDSCTVGAGDCCSTNCVANAGGSAGTCLPAYACHAYDDVCFRSEECCSGVCDTSLSSPGRCKRMPGSCTQDGNPCTSGTNCCTRLCLDLGSGVAVCQPAAGCRMTGDYCDRTQACCGGSPDALHPTSDPYGVFCDTAGRDRSPPRNDASTKDDFRCTNGTSCNPPGNICGGSGAVNAPQSCCDGKKAVCKPDSNGIYRCFGGCPNDDCSRCPGGYDANDPACCIPAVDPDHVGTANVCQFRDQCCGGAPCVPDPATGVLHCLRPLGCTPTGGACSGADDRSCCAPDVCQETAAGSGDWRCAVQSTGCTQAGGTCAGDASCCSQLCRDGGAGARCVSCLPNGETCSTDGPCCSGRCDAGTCAASCIADGGACTTDRDCCTGTVCDLPPGATSGTCSSPRTCGGYGDPCNDAMPCCWGTCLTGQSTPCTGLVSGCTCGE